MSQIKELNESVRVESKQPIVRSVEAELPAETTYISARVKLHTSEPGESGLAEIHWIKLERLA